MFRENTSFETNLKEKKYQLGTYVGLRYVYVECGNSPQMLNFLKIVLVTALE